jgi:hypothetical protein
VLQGIGRVRVIAERVEMRQQIDVELLRPGSDPLTGNNKLGTAACVTGWGIALQLVVLKNPTG